ncbi:MAG: exonuclease SbcCD subunit D [Candidatus Nanopelagicales bacterium]
MRLLHTSDWHLGRNFHGFDLIDAQRRFVEHLVEVVRSEGIDAVLVAGDIYDRAIPSLDAVEVFEHGLAELSRFTQVIISSGNHDSQRRLGFGGALMERAGVHFRTHLADITRPVVLDNGRMRTSIYAIPFLEPYTSAAHLGDDGAVPVKRTHEGVMAAAMGRIAEHRALHGADRTIVTAHAWFNGCEPSDSEVDLSMGGIGKASTALLEPFDYAALGHLHKPQAIADHLRYSGSPLHYSFSEIGSSKQSLIVDLSSAQPLVTAVPVPVDREIHELRDSLEALLTSPAYEPYRHAFLRIHLTDLPVPEQAANRLRQRFPYLADLRVTELQAGVGLEVEQLRTLSTLDICNLFLAEVRGAEADPWEQRRLELAIAYGRGVVDTVTDDEGPCEDTAIDSSVAAE